MLDGAGPVQIAGSACVLNLLAARSVRQLARDLGVA
jgi:hypothetical protein